MGNSIQSTFHPIVVDWKKVSWVDKMIIWMDRQPIPLWLLYILITIAAQLLFNIPFWIDGSVPIWKNVILTSIFFPMVALGLGFYHFLGRTGEKALQEFRPLLNMSEEEFERINYSLNYLPSWANWVVLIWGIVGSIPYVFQSSNTFGEIIPKSNLPLITVFIASVISIIPVLGLIIRIIRQVRIVNDLHHKAENIKLLHLFSAHSFAKLTASTGGGFIIFLSMAILYNPTLITGANMIGTFFGLICAILIFVIPLISMRDRLEIEKQFQLKKISDLLQMTLDQVNETVGSKKASNISEIRLRMSALIEERELVEKISTWPWNTGTIRGFVSTLVIPILLWFITNYLGKFL